MMLYQLCGISVGESPLTLERIADYPTVSHIYNPSGRTKLIQPFKARGLYPMVVFMEIDSDAVKNCVWLGLGIGITAPLAYQPSLGTYLCTLRK